MFFFFFKKSRVHDEHGAGSEAQDALTVPVLGHKDWEEKRHQLLLQKMQLEVERERLQVRLVQQEERLNRQNQQLQQSCLHSNRCCGQKQGFLPSSRRFGRSWPSNLFLFSLGINRLISAGHTLMEVRVWKLPFNSSCPQGTGSWKWSLERSNQIGTNVCSCVYWTYNNAALLRSKTTKD